MNTRPAARSSGFGSFFFGMLVALVALGAGILWWGTQEPVTRLAKIEPHLSLPAPDLPDPPGLIPDSGKAPKS